MCSVGAFKKRPQPTDCGLSERLLDQTTFRQQSKTSHVASPDIAGLSNENTEPLAATVEWRGNNGVTEREASPSDNGFRCHVCGKPLVVYLVLGLLGWTIQFNEINLDKK